LIRHNNFLNVILKEKTVDYWPFKEANTPNNFAAMTKASHLVRKRYI